MSDDLFASVKALSKLVLGFYFWRNVFSMMILLPSSFIKSNKLLQTKRSLVSNEVWLIIAPLCS
ncbi:hypothetical protein [Infirmifilum uzonense]|uniref:hypothetical protein n=1 Tax=Infirmifilum uzonense TaxID=1550241 RepID=UPI00168D0EFB|nr:hypothetical protein [Infirmifilum uzonense]